MKNKGQLLKEIKVLKKRISELEKIVSERDKAKQLVIDTDRRLQEIAQELKRENERLIADQKRMVKQSEAETPVKGKKAAKLTTEEEKKTLKELQVKYNNLLDAHTQRNENKTDTLVNELCGILVQKDISTKKIIGLHLESIKKFSDDVNELSARRRVFSARTVLLMVMTRYASLLRNQR